MAKYRIHGTDQYGSFSIECESDEEYSIHMEDFHENPLVEDVWVEYFDPEEGWQA